MGETREVKHNALKFPFSDEHLPYISSSHLMKTRSILKKLAREPVKTPL